jgi:leader peptidase (prepilin peptidase)/N-methyltransferase
MDLSQPILIALLGLSVGSFLNVCIYRLPRGESLVSPPSRCPACGRRLRWFDNVPVVSWIWLRGRCGRCRAPISVRYPIVEIVTALVWLLIAWLTPPGWLLASRLMLGTSLIALFVIDLEHQLLPNAITLPGIAAGLALSVVTPVGPLASLIGIVAGGGVLYAIAAGYYLVRHEEGMGMGDVKMLAMVGAFLGWKGVLLTLVLSSLSGAVLGLLIIAWKRGDMRYALPFGTFLALAAGVAMLYGERILGWYFGFFPDMSS